MFATGSKQIVIVGAGFGGLAAARRLRKLMPAAEITLVAPVDEFQYLPSLIWIPTGLRDGAELRLRFTPLLTRLCVRYVEALATGLDPAGRKLHTTKGDIAYDGLIIASGGAWLKKLPGAMGLHGVCEGVDAAQAVRARLLDLAKAGKGRIALSFATNPQEQGAMRGGPVFEMLFGLDTWLRREKLRERFELTFFHASNAPGQRLGEQAVEVLLGRMAQKGIRTVLGKKPVGFEDQDVLLDSGERIESDLTLLVPGMRGQDWFANTGLELSPGGFVKADDMCRTSAEGAYVVGDAGSFPGPDWLPKQAHMADLQAVAAAQNLADALQGRTPHHKPRVELVCIVDSLDAGVLVWRTPKRSFLFASRLLHPAKRLFEWYYLRDLRSAAAKFPAAGA